VPPSDVTQSDAPSAAIPASEVPAPGAPRSEIAIARVGIIMGSQSDWATMMHASETLTALGVPHEARIVSAHRTPDRLREYATSARDRGLRVIIAGAGGAAHLPGMAAAWTPLPVLGVPVESHALKGMDSLLSIVQMPAGIPVGTLAIGRAGAVNAALLAAAILATTDAALAERLDAWRARQTGAVAAEPAQLASSGEP
jgi:5-(carboxyamino)imidazole ribonucleotide mutase